MPLPSVELPVHVRLLRPPGCACTRREFEGLVADALDTIPPDLLAAMDNVVVLVEGRNAADPELLGLYEGVALTERTSDYGGVLPDRITIYQDAIVDICADRDEVVHEVAVTVVHEIAHHFGIDEDTLHDGWAGVTEGRWPTLSTQWRGRHLHEARSATSAPPRDVAAPPARRPVPVLQRPAAAACP